MNNSRILSDTNVIMQYSHNYDSQIPNLFIYMEVYLLKTNLQQYFPMIRSREDILNEINQKHFLKNIFYNWQEEQQEQFLNYCSGTKGLKILYSCY